MDPCLLLAALDLSTCCGVLSTLVAVGVAADSFFLRRRGDAAQSEGRLASIEAKLANIETTQQLILGKLL